MSYISRWLLLVSVILQISNLEAILYSGHFFLYTLHVKPDGQAHTVTHTPLPRLVRIIAYYNTHHLAFTPGIKPDRQTRTVAHIPLIRLDAIVAHYNKHDLAYLRIRSLTGGRIQLHIQDYMLQAKRYTPHKALPAYGTQLRSSHISGRYLPTQNVSSNNSPLI